MHMINIPQVALSRSNSLLLLDFIEPLIFLTNGEGKDLWGLPIYTFYSDLCLSLCASPISDVSNVNQCWADIDAASCWYCYLQMICNITSVGFWYINLVILAYLRVGVLVAMIAYWYYNACLPTALSTHDHLYNNLILYFL